MGASSFELNIFAKNEKEFAWLFKSEAEDDRRENGSGAYSGTIGQKNGWKMLKQTPVSKKELEKLKEEHEGDKWGDAMACPVAEEVKSGKPKTKTFKLESDATYMWELRSAAMSAAREKFEGEIELVGKPKCIKNAKYKMEKLDRDKGWAVQGDPEGRRFSKKAEAQKVMRALVKENKEGFISLTYIDDAYKRVKTSEAVFEVTVTIQKYRTTKKLSHYCVWGWASE